MSEDIKVVLRDTAFVLGFLGQAERSSVLETVANLLEAMGIKTGAGVRAKIRELEGKETGVGEEAEAG